jgi:hypothetical protein
MALRLLIVSLTLLRSNNKMYRSQSCAATKFYKVASMLIGRQTRMQRVFFRHQVRKSHLLHPPIASHMNSNCTARCSCYEGRFMRPSGPVLRRPRERLRRARISRYSATLPKRTPLAMMSFRVPALPHMPPIKQARTRKKGCLLTSHGGGTVAGLGRGWQQSHVRLR